MFFPLVLGKVMVPVPTYAKGKGLVWRSFPLFRLFPVKALTTEFIIFGKQFVCSVVCMCMLHCFLNQILALAIVWSLSTILTVTGVFSDDPGAMSYRARTDVKLESLEKAAWFYFPYPCV